MSCLAPGKEEGARSLDAPRSPYSSAGEVAGQGGEVGATGMAISFSSTGSTSSDSEEDCDILIDEDTLSNRQSSNSSLIFIVPPTHTNSTPRKTVPTFPSDVHGPSSIFRHPPLPLTAVAKRRSRRLSSSYFEFTPSLADQADAQPQSTISVPYSRLHGSADQIFAEMKTAKREVVRKRRSSAPSLASSSSTLRQSVAIPSFGPGDEHQVAPPISPRTLWSPDAWRGIQRTLSLSSKDGSRTRNHGSSRASVLPEKHAEHGRQVWSATGDEIAATKTERLFSGPNSPVLCADVDEWLGDLGTLGHFPKPPGTRESVHGVCLLGPPLFLMPKDEQEESDAESHSSSHCSPHTPATPPPSANSGVSVESSLRPHTPACAIPDTEESCLPPPPLIPRTSNTHTFLPMAPKSLAPLTPALAKQPACAVNTPTASALHATGCDSPAQKEKLDALQQSSSLIVSETSSIPGLPQSSMSYDDHFRDWQDNSLPPLSHTFHHRSRPSVPSSTRTASSLSPSDPISSPQSYASSSLGSGHNSRFTCSGPEGSSIYSYSTADSSLRGHSGWISSERPDISTVFEEECSDGRSYRKENPSLKDKHSPSRSSGRQYSPLAAQVPLTTPASPESRKASHHNSYFSRDRSGNSNTSGKSSKSVHPFANAVLRPASPPPSTPKRTLLSPQAPLRTGINTTPSSRLSPNLAEAYKMAQPSVALVSTEDDGDGDVMCPVCVEPMGFTYRLPGEKPPIVPECGHALHEECFSHVYGEAPPEGSRKVLGVCGVCRQPMKLAEGAAKKDKLAAIMGQPGQSNRSRTLLPAPSIRSTSGRGAPPTPLDATADDPIDNSRHALSTGQQPKVVVPTLSIKSEFATLTKKRGKQTISTMITVQIPQAPERGKYPAATKTANEAHFSPHFEPQLPPSPTSARDSSTASPKAIRTSDPFAHVVQDLKNRVVDLKQLNLDSVGPLKLFDILSVRKGSLVREFHVYLFRDALVCVAEEKKSGFRQYFSSNSSMRSEHSGHSSRTVLKLKGRIYLRHVSGLVANSARGDYSISLQLHEQSVESFVLSFKERGSFETWKTTMERLMDDNQTPRDRAAKILGPGAPGCGASGLGISFADLNSPGSYATTPNTSLSFRCDTHAVKEQTPGDLAYIQPLAPVHTPIDLVLVLSLPAFSAGQSIPLKVKLMRSSLEFLLALLGPKDRISLVSCEMGLNGTLRKTPFLCTTRYESRKRLEAFVETLGAGKQQKDEFEVPVESDEKLDVVTAMNVALDVVLQRKSKNPLSSMIIVSDTADSIKRAQMDLVTARLDAANVTVHGVGYGRSHDPSPLWIVTGHTLGSYTFVKEWYHLRETLAGIVGGMMSIAITNVKLHVSCVDNDFVVLRVNGTTQTVVVPASSKNIDISLQDLRYGDTREIIVELETDVRDGSNEQRYSGEGSSESEHFSESISQRTGSLKRAPSAMLGMDALSVGDSNSALRDNAYEGSIDELPVCEVDLAFRDPSAGRSVSRLPHPQLLTVTVFPQSQLSSTPADPVIIRRRMELLASDMLTRALLIASRKNYAQTDRILRETKRIIETMQDNVRQHITDHTSTRRGRSKRELQAIAAMEGLEGPLQDLESLLDMMEEQKEVFDRDCRNFTAQQSGVLRSQRAWTARTLSENTYLANETRSIVQMSAEFQLRL